MAYSYNDKYKGEGQGRLSVYDILQKVGTTEYTNGVKKEYEAVDIHKVVIGGNTFKNYGVYQFIWEKSFVKSPERSAGGQLANLPSHATFLTAHLILDFSVMSIDDYRKIMQLHYNANEYTVECYDTIYNRKIKVKMYFATEEMAKLYTIAQHRLLDNGQWQDWVDIVGVTDYKVELIGTNNDLDLVSVKYVYNAPLNSNGDPVYPNGVPVPDQHEESVYVGEEIVVGANSTFPTTPPNRTYKFKQWKDANGVVYTDQMAVTVNGELTLYAVWEPTTSFTLSFNYGLSDVATEVDENGVLSEVLNREITNVNDIGKLPPLTNPSEKYNGELKYPYINGAWYRHPVKQDNMKVTDNQKYWIARDTIIYALYDKMKYTVTYVTNTEQIAVPIQFVTYGDQVYLPTLARNGYTFKGWYIDDKFEKVFSGVMPPESITLHAKWEAN